MTARGDDPANSDRSGVREGWSTLTWAEVRERGLDVPAGLVEIGVCAGDNVAIMATKRTAHVLADVGAVHAGATPMSIYNTLSPEQVAFVAGQSEPTVAFLESADHLERWSSAIDALWQPARDRGDGCPGLPGRPPVPRLGDLAGARRRLPRRPRRRGPGARGWLSPLLHRRPRRTAGDAVGGPAHSPPSPARTSEASSRAR